MYRKFSITYENGKPLHHREEQWCWENEDELLQHIGNSGHSFTHAKYDRGKIEAGIALPFIGYCSCSYKRQQGVKVYCKHCGYEPSRKSLQ